MVLNFCHLHYIPNSANVDFVSLFETYVYDDYKTCKRMQAHHYVMYNYFPILVQAKAVEIADFPYYILRTFYIKGNEYFATTSASIASTFRLSTVPVRVCTIHSVMSNLLCICSDT